MPPTNALYRSLYWRIAIGFILCIATVLAIQGTLSFWLIDRRDAEIGLSLTKTVSDEIAAALEADPGLDLERYMRARYADTARPFYAVMTDNRVIAVGDKAPSTRLVEAALSEFRHGDGQTIPPAWQEQPFLASAILVNGSLLGAVGIVPQTWMEQRGPTLVIASATLLVLGTALASIFIFGPAHRRLRDLEIAALRLGSGDLMVRARTDGGDEVTALARAFNHMADDLATRAEQIAASDRARRLLLADVSHELMTPLTAVRGYQERLAADPVIQASEQRSRYLTIIGDETQRVERIVGDLLDLARLESAGKSLERGDVSVEGLFGRVAARHEPMAAGKRVRFSTQIEPGAEIVSGDAFRLEQAVQNLAANAIRYAPEDGCVQLRAMLRDGEVWLTVRDNGPGVAAEDVPFVFDRFYKADRARTGDTSGSGLGLSIVKAIVERHGGSVTVSSTAGGGTTFTMRLPAGVEDPAVQDHRHERRLSA